MAHSSLAKGGPGRAERQLCLVRLSVVGRAAGRAAPGAPVKLVNPRATFEQDGMPVAAAIDDNQKTAWAVDPQFGRDHAASFDIEVPIANEQGTTLTFVLKFENNAGHNIGRLRLALSTTAKPVGLDGDAEPDTSLEAVEQALAVPPAERNEQQHTARRLAPRGTTPTGKSSTPRSMNMRSKLPSPS